MVKEKKKKRFLKIFLWTFPVILVGLFIWYLAANREVNQLDQSSREKLGGTYITLSEGVTHYELTGPEAGLVVVMVHGATIPSWDWDLQMKALTDAGFRVLRYDMFGRGRSDRPEVEYNRDLYRKQLLELLDGLDLKDPIDLVGHSFGGATVTNFTATHPDRVRRLALVAPVINSIPDRKPFLVARTPIVGPFLVRTIMVNVVTKRAQALLERSGVDIIHYLRLFKKQTTYKGFESSLISMFQTDALGDYREFYKKVGETGKPVMMVWGTEDGDISKDNVDFVKESIPHMVLHIFEGVGHSPNMESAGKFNYFLIKFLEKPDSI